MPFGAQRAPSPSFNENPFRSLRVLSAIAWFRKLSFPQFAAAHGNIFCGYKSIAQWSEFLVQLRFWGFLHGVLMVNLEPLSGCAVKTAHIPESKIEEDAL